MVPEIWSATDRIVCHVGLFLPTYPPNNVENQNFEKMNKIPGDIIILYICTINENHMMYCMFLRYGAWQMEFLFSFWTVFCPFASLTTQKTRILKKCKKKHGDIILPMECNRQNFFSFLTIFCPFNPPPPSPAPPAFPAKNPENQNFEKMKKMPGEIVISQKCTINDN